MAQETQTEARYQPKGVRCEGKVTRCTALFYKKKAGIKSHVQRIQRTRSTGPFPGTSERSDLCV